MFWARTADGHCVWLWIVGVLGLWTGLGLVLAVVLGRGIRLADQRSFGSGVERHYLVRTTWVVGDGQNFVRTMATLAERGVRPTVVDDQIGRPTFTADLAAGIRHLIAVGAPFGTYNLTCGGEPASWAEVAATVYEALGHGRDEIGRVSTAEYFADKPGAARRPLNSVLDLTKITATGFRPRDWRAALPAYLAGLR